MNAPFANTTALAHRKSVQDIADLRDRALALYQEAHGVIASAEAALNAARMAAHAATGGVNRYNHHLKDEKTHFINAIQVNARDDYMAIARRMIDTDCWAHVIELTDLETLMDKKAKDQFNQQLLDSPPEFTVENVMATLEQFMLDAGTIFKRGIAECFTKLDRRFRSHDGWKIGSRIILTNVFDAHGWWSYYGNHRDTFVDVERVFRVLDGERPGYCSLNSALERARRDGWGARQTEVETDYFLLRAWKNGNAHIWFKRKDLLERVNQLLGEYYGAPIPEDREAEENPFANIKTTPAKRYGFFPTPAPAVDFFIEHVPLLRETGAPRLKVLEPSAGTGNLARACIGNLSNERRVNTPRYRRDALVDCVEVQPALADDLRSDPTFRKVYTADFLQLQPETTGLYDRVVMNPPFDRERDIDHVMHALKFLKPDGMLAAIMSAGTEFRETKKSAAFRELMNSMGAEWKDMPAGSFSSVGTHCNTGALYVWKNGTESRGRWARKAFKTPGEA